MTLRRTFSSPIASAKIIAAVYASSPVAQPVDQILIGSSGSRSSTMRGTISSAMYSHALGSRKNDVTLIRIVSKRCANSSVLSAT